MNKKFMNKTKAILFANEYNHISLRDLEEIMESLEDYGYLSEKGKKFRKSFWSMFIKETNKK